MKLPVVLRVELDNALRREQDLLRYSKQLEAALDRANKRLRELERQQ